MANNNAFIDVRIGTASAEKDLNKVVNALTKMGNVHIMLQVATMMIV